MIKKNKEKEKNNIIIENTDLDKEIFVKKLLLVGDEKRKIHQYIVEDFINQDIDNNIKVIYYNQNLENCKKIANRYEKIGKKVCFIQKELTKIDFDKIDIFILCESVFIDDLIEQIIYLKNKNHICVYLTNLGDFKSKKIKKLLNEDIYFVLQIETFNDLEKIEEGFKFCILNNIYNGIFCTGSKYDDMIFFDYINSSKEIGFVSPKGLKMNQIYVNLKDKKQFILELDLENIKKDF